MNKDKLQKEIQALKPFLPKQKHYDINEIGHIRIRQTFTKDIAPNLHIALKRIKKKPKNISSYLFLSHKNHAVGRVFPETKNKKAKIAYMDIDRMKKKLWNSSEFHKTNGLITAYLDGNLK